MGQQPATLRTRSGDLLLHPIAVLAVVVLVINDHVLKPQAPGLLTGKISDFAGLLFFPLLLVSVVELAALPLRRRPPDRRSLAVSAIVVTALVFGLVKTTATGSLAFGWFVGIAQWLAIAGPLRGVGPQPVAVAVDPGDLIAMAALAGAWFVGRGERWAKVPRMGSLPAAHRPAPSRQAALMLVVASLATMATGGGYVEQYKSTAWNQATHLDDVHQVATRHISYDVDTAGYFVKSVQLSAAIDPGVLWTAAKPGITLTLVPDESADGPVWSPVNLSDSCIPTCHGGATIIARLTGAAPDGVDLTLQGTLDAYGAEGNAKFEPSLAIRGDDSREFNGNPASALDKAEATMRVSSDHTKATQRFAVRVDAAALKSPLAYPLVATVETYAQITKMEHSDVPGGIMTIGGTEIPLNMGLPYQSIDVLSVCKAGRTCNIPITVEADYSAHLGVMDPPSIPHSGSADIVLRIRVRLAAFDGRTLPAEAVSIAKTQ